MHDPIVLTARAAVVPTNRSYDELLDLARENAPDGSVFDEYEAVFWRAAVSNNRLDFYATSMGERSLKNYVEDLTAGVSFQDSHNWGKLGIGQSVLGELTEDKKETLEYVDQHLRQVHGTFFTLKDVELGGHKTNNFIAALRSGTYRDVSIGFYARDISCSICGKQAFQWWKEDGCLHLPGVEYEDEDTGKVELAWASINDGRLMETSQVYDGATPGAEVNQVVSKADALAEERKISPREVATIERRYAVRLREPKAVFAVGQDFGQAGGTATATYPTRGGNTMAKVRKSQTEDQAVLDGDEDQTVIDPVEDETDEDEITPVDRTAEDEDDSEDDAEGTADDDADDDDAVTHDAADTVPDETVIEAEDVNDEEDEDVADEEGRGATPDVLAAERTRLAEHGIKLGRDPALAVKALGDALIDERRRSADLAKDADLGKRYRKNVIEDALAEGVRARGDAFQSEQWRGILESLPLDKIETIRDDFREEATRTLTKTPVVTNGERRGAGDEVTARRKRAAHKA